MIYLDNAATTWPKPRSVVEAVQKALLHYGANPGRSGHKMASETAEQIYRCREKAADLFYCQPEQVVFTLNCTHAINSVLCGLLRRGDHVLISDLEHNAVSRCIHQLFLDGICTYSIVPTFNDEEETVFSFYRAIRPNTRLIFCTHGSNVFGNILPIGKIAAMAHQCGIYFAADCAQTAGVLDIDLSREPIDFLCMPGHKGLYGPSGTGLLICNCTASLRPLMQGGTGSDSLRLEMPDYLPERMESGTVNTAGIIGLSAGLSYVQGHGVKKIYTFEQRLIQQLYDSLCDVPWVRFYGPKPQYQHSLPLLSLTLGSMSGSETADWLEQHGSIATRGGFHCAKLAHESRGTDHCGTCRISPASFNTKKDIDTVCRIIKAKKIP